MHGDAGLNGGAVWTCVCGFTQQAGGGRQFAGGTAISQPRHRRPAMRLSRAWAAGTGLSTEAKQRDQSTMRVGRAALEDALLPPVLLGQAG